MTKEEAIYQTAKLLVQHFQNYIEMENSGLPTGIHSRIFTHILHPEREFVTVGQSEAVKNGAIIHPEHIVPCSLIIYESIRLLKEGKSQEDVSQLIVRHWKIVNISKDERVYIDTKAGLNLNSNMPNGWDYETGDSFARLSLANIKVLPLENNLNNP